MDRDAIKAIVQRGEDSRHQFKADVASPDALAAEVVAFLNADGGDILIGVDDGGMMPGLDASSVRRINQMVSNVASQHVKNPISLLTENVSVGEGQVVVVVHVPAGNDKPYFDKNGIVWLKEGADKRKVASKEEIRRLFEASASLHADEQPTKADFGQLDLLRFRPFFEKTYGLPMPEENRELVRTVKNMNLATDDDRLNLAGLLMFGRHPEHFVPQFCIKAARVNGTDFSFMSYADREDYAGTLPDLYAGAMAFVLRNMHKRQRAESVNMPGESEIPRVVFEEIIVNALVHRNYFVDAPIRILVFDDRVEVISPGSLPNHLTVEKVLAGNTNIRNPIIASYVARGLLPYWGLGSGIRRAQSAWQNIRFINDRAGVQFRVVIYKELPEHDSADEGLNETISPGEGINGSIKSESGGIKSESGGIKSESGGIKYESGGIKYESGGIKYDTESQDEALLNIVSQHPGCKVDAIQSITGFACRSIERSLARLIESKKIEYRGSKKTGGYYVIESARSTKKT